jgi:hypothetical protein
MVSKNAGRDTAATAAGRSAVVLAPAGRLATLILPLPTPKCDRSNPTRSAPVTARAPPAARPGFSGAPGAFAGQGRCSGRADRRGGLVRPRARFPVRPRPDPSTPGSRLRRGAARELPAGAGGMSRRIAQSAEISASTRSPGGELQLSPTPFLPLCVIVVLNVAVRNFFVLMATDSSRSDI